MKRRSTMACGPLLAACLALTWASPAGAQWQIEAKDGRSHVKVGFLAQPQLEVLETPDAEALSQNIFLRRFRLVLGGKLADGWTFFFETDSPNLGKSNPDCTINPTGAKDAGFLYLQDAYVTYSPREAFKVDAGIILAPLGHHHNQSAATLLAVDYSPFGFPESTALGTRMGRDYGVQVRGYPLKQHLEYRLGVFQGSRGVEARNSLRVAGRAAWYPFAADAGFFYAGTFHATKRVLGVGASLDRQEEYRQFGADVFAEQPMASGTWGLTFQANWMRFDGKAFLPSVPRQDTFLVEAGAHFLQGRLSPFFQYSGRAYDAAPLADQRCWQAGVAWWMAGHQRNLKVSAGRQHTAGVPDRTHVLAQLQVFFF